MYTYIYIYIYSYTHIFGRRIEASLDPDDMPCNKRVVFKMSGHY